MEGGYPYQNLCEGDVRSLHLNHGVRMTDLNSLKWIGHSPATMSAKTPKHDLLASPQLMMCEQS
jgi:hypothetical protein